MKNWKLVQKSRVGGGNPLYQDWLWEVASKTEELPAGIAEAIPAGGSIRHADTLRREQNPLLSLIMLWKKR